MKPFTKEEKTEIARLIQKVKKSMGLKDKPIKVSFKDVGDKLMTAYEHRGQNLGHIAISCEHGPKCYREDVRFFHRTIIHELLHIHTFQMQQFVVQHIGNAISKREYTSFYDDFEQHEEMFVDRLAVGLYKVFKKAGVFS